MFHQGNSTPYVDGGGWIIVPGLGPVWVPPWRPDQFGPSGRFAQLLAAVGVALDRMPSEVAIIQQHVRDLIKESGKPQRGAEAQLGLTQRLMERTEARRAIARVASQVVLPATPAVSPWRMDPNPDEDSEGGGANLAPTLGSIIAFFVVAIILGGIFG